MARGDPGEATYTPQVMPEVLPRKIIPHMDTSPVGPALEQFGNAVNAKYQADSATWAGDQVAAFRLKAVQDLDTMKAQVPAGQDPGDFTQKYLAQFDKSATSLADTAGNNPFARVMVEKGVGDLRNTLASHTLGWEAQQRVAYRNDSIAQNLTTQLPIVEAHPELADQVGSTLMDQINANGADPSSRLLLARQMHTQLSMAAANGLARQNPRGVIDGLNNPEGAPSALRDLTDQQREAVRAKANEHLGDPVLTSLTNGDLGGAQHALDANKDVMDPKLAWTLQRNIDAQVKEKQNDQKQDIADRFADSMQAAEAGLSNPVTVSRAEMEILYPKDAQRHWDGLQSMVEAGAKARDYDQMTPAQIQQDLAGKRPTEGGPEAAFALHSYGILARAAEQSLRARAQDPAQFAIDSKQGWSPIDLSDPKAALDELRSRANTAPTVSAQVGGPVPLLSNGESRQFSQMLDGQVPRDRLGTLTALHNALPDERAYYSVLQQIAPHSPVTAIVGARVGQPNATNQPSWYDQQFSPNPADGETILAGEALLNPQGSKNDQEGGRSKAAFPMPPDGGSSGLRMLYSKATGDLFRDRPDLAEAHFSAFKDAYAALLSQKGDMKGIGDSTLAARALKMSLGTTVDFNGRTMSVPPGMDPTQYETSVRRAVQTTATTMDAPADWAERMRGYQLQELGALGSGRYQVLNGNMPVTVRGQPFIVDLQDLHPARGVIER